MRWLREQFELSRGGSDHNVRPMEGLRGFAVFLVFLVHYVTLIEPWLPEQASIRAFAGSLHAIGNTGVDLFFVLSGYLIYGSLITRNQQFGRFIHRRIQRIYPAFIVVFVIYVLLSFAFPSESKIPSDATEGFVYLAQNFLLLPGILPIEPLITVAWSLSYELFYYLVIPLVIAVFRLRDRSAAWRVSFFMIVASLLAAYCFAYGGHVRLIMFIAGILLYEVMESSWFLSPPSLLGFGAFCVGILGTLVPVSGTMGAVLKTLILFVAFFFLCLTCFRNHLIWLSRVFSWAPLRWLGNMSYSYYLIHGLALKAGFLVLPKVLPDAGFDSWLFWALLPPMFVLTLVPASALFLLVERPLSIFPEKRRDPNVPAAVRNFY
ncbi:peptidoglycan/LPS O-acetylase OafA/YrhL [Paucimonas lemoignei]|uniref:Peptidoglycan/LPS O-acetylase OafA/YrhL n=1 Tax=Paucimonas lemoignei TaxID=29443 RepID=A0A4R3HYU8_PAULE|nr:acyltransferase [Paucimonas lemoignei]TCS38557.1 peptidoglycan/LPS O-acetylase OafA/YrhL [Paucimonas lemoignei]